MRRFKDQFLKDREATLQRLIENQKRKNRAKKSAFFSEPAASRTSSAFLFAGLLGQNDDYDVCEGTWGPHCEGVAFNAAENAYWWTFWSCMASLDGWFCPWCCEEQASEAWETAYSGAYSDCMENHGCE